MANANLALLVSTNTFLDWMITTNNEANTINELRNGNFYKDGGNFTVANGTIVTLPTTGTGLQIGANSILGALTTMNTSLTTGAASLSDNVTLTGVNSSLQAANSIQTKYANVNTTANITGSLVLTGKNANGNVTYVASISNEPTINVANNFLLANTGIAEWKNNVNFSNASATVNVAGTINSAFVVVLQNTTTGNLSVTQNTSGGNLSVTQNTTTGNLSVTTLANIATLNVSSNIVTGNLKVTQNTSEGNLSVTQNIAGGNLSITQNAIFGNANAANLNVSTTLSAISIVFDTTGAYSQSQGNLTINNLTVSGNQTIQGNTTLTTDTFQLRTGSSSDGDGHFEVYRGSTIAANAQIKFNKTANVIQFAANDAQTFSTILTAANIADVVSSVSVANVGSANAVNTAYSAAVGAYAQANAGYTQANTSYAQANAGSLKANAAYVLANQGFVVGTQAFINANLAYGQANLAYTAANSSANTVRVSQNSGSTLSQKQLNFVNTANVTIVVTDDGGGNANIAISSSAGQPPGGADKQIQFNDSTVFNGSANVIYVKANGQMIVNNQTMTANLTFAVGANCVQPTLASTREVMTNAATINSPNTYTMNITNTNNFDITLGNTQFNSCNLTFNNWANSGNLQTITLILRQPGPNGNTSQTSANVVTFTNANVYWSSGEVPVLATFKGKADILTFVTVDGGTTILGAHSMANVG